MAVLTGPPVKEKRCARIRAYIVYTAMYVRALYACIITIPNYYKKEKRERESDRERAKEREDGKSRTIIIREIEIYLRSYGHMTSVHACSANKRLIKRSKNMVCTSRRCFEKCTECSEASPKVLKKYITASIRTPRVAETVLRDRIHRTPFQ